MSQLYVSRSHVRKSLVSAATTRALVIVAAPIVVLALLALAFPAALSALWPAVAAIVVAPLLAAWIVTLLLCRRAVKCPACEGNLWEIGTGSLLPGRMKIKDEVTSCPHCGAVLI